VRLLNQQKKVQAELFTMFPKPNGGIGLVADV
jgi:hypothetical protein